VPLLTEVKFGTEDCNLIEASDTLKMFHNAKQYNERTWKYVVVLGQDKI